MLRVKYKPFMLSVVMLYVITLGVFMPSVVKPIETKVLVVK